jgi:hypothetical protein
MKQGNWGRIQSVKAWRVMLALGNAAMFRACGCGWSAESGRQHEHQAANDQLVHDTPQ